ncbi:MAG: hypothetical protein Q9227_003109 [Pyrenula ochraceoflavens]
MSLLQNEDFAIWQLRTSYLANIKDGVGERLINVNSSVLNGPGFRAAGWSTNSADVKRTYSPPIPTAFNSDYFALPARLGGHVQTPGSAAEEEEEGGMVTGGGSNDTIGPGPAFRRRRRREQADEDDSSDLSDESDDDADGPQRAAQQIKFAKMPVRDRSDSSPIRSLDRKDGPEVLITSPSRRSTDSRFRRASLGAVEAVKARSRRDTATSSEMSSETELDPSVFQRRQVRSRTGTQTSNPLTPRVEEEEPELPPSGEAEEVDSDGDSEGSALSSEFDETMESGSLLDSVGVAGLPSSSPVLANINSSNPSNLSPKKTRTIPSLQALPPARPISLVNPVSLLGSAIRAKKQTPTNPIESFASLSGKGTPNPLYIKIYTPFSEDSSSPLEVLLQRVSKEGTSISVVEAIGFSLWRYCDEKREPLLPQEKLNVNKWTLRIVEDGEVDFDFPALQRTKPIIDFTSNNNRGARARSREKPWDEFGLVEATAEQVRENERLTPKYNVVEETVESPENPKPDTPVMSQPGLPRTAGPRSIPVISQPFSSALNDKKTVPADLPEPTKIYNTRAPAPQKTIKIRYLDLNAYTQTATMEISIDSYIAEILDFVCRRWNLDKAGFTLRIAGTSTLALLDRTVEALGDRSELDLVRKRFVGGPYSLTGSPGSSSPNAPLLIDIDGPKKSKKGHPLAQKQDIVSLAGNFKRFNVVRKTNLSFSQANQKILTFDQEYLHILPAETGRTLFETSSKSTSIPFHNVRLCKVSKKHKKIVRLFVTRLNEMKRYDFEARNGSEAVEIVEEIRKYMRPQT